MGKVKELMGQSIITDNLEQCYICKTKPAEIHHIVFGTANRDLSTKFGLIVPLCPMHHREGPHAVHRDRNADLYFKRLAQKQFGKHFPEYNFQEVFGKDYT